MKRKIYAKLVEWKNQECHKPLILNGVRLIFLKNSVVQSLIILLM